MFRFHVSFGGKTRCAFGRLIWQPMTPKNATNRRLQSFSGKKGRLRIIGPSYRGYGRVLQTDPVIFEVQPKKWLKIPCQNKNRCFNASFIFVPPAPQEPRYDINLFFPLSQDRYSCSVKGIHGASARHNSMKWKICP